MGTRERARVRERARTQAEIARLASFPLTNPQPVVEADLEGRVWFLNPAAERLFPDLRRRGADHPWLTHWDSVVRACRAGRKDLPTREVPVNARWYRQALYYASDVRRVRIYGLDITERKRAEEALRKSHDEAELRVQEQTAELSGANARLAAEVAERKRAENAAAGERQRLNDVLEMLPAYVVLLTPDYHVPFANRFFRERFGEAHGRRCFEFLFGRSEPCEVCDTFAVLKTNAPHEWEWIGPDGRNYQVFDFPFTDADGSPLIMEMGIDVTEQKRAREEIRKLNEELERRVVERTGELSRANDELQKEIRERRQVEEALRESREDLNHAQAVAHTGSWRLDVRRDELRWSDENHRIFGVPRGTPLTYETFLAAVHPDDREFVDRAWQAGLRGEHYDIEHRIVVGDDVRWVRERAELEFDGEGGLLGGFGTTQDITERRQAEQALRQTAQELARSNKDLEQFAYAISHDLREPLRMVTGFTGLLRDRYKGQLDGKADEYLGFAADGASRMQGLIDDLLAYSRAGEHTATERTDVGAVLDRVLANLTTSIEESGAQLTHDPFPTIRCSAIGLTQVLQNLVGNAIKFRGDRTPEIHVGARREDNCWLFTVRDNGIGMDPKSTDRIFMIFQRLHTREEYPGSGIGLAICKKIVERHGGRIWVESRPGTGSTFFFTMPDRGKEEK